jgi:branched-chain amino acid aminotransferase
MSMADRDGKIWMDGRLIDWRDATIHVLTHTLHYGMGVFEGVRAYKTDAGTAIFRLPEHTRRLLNSAKIFQMKLAYDFDTLVAAQKEVVRANGLESCYLRPIAWLGSEKLGVSPKGNTVHVAIAAWPWGAYLGEDGLAKGIRVKTASFARHHVNVSMVRAKASGYYVNSILANTEALEAGYDEALLLDTDGYVSEGSGENVFIVKDGRLYTPDLASCLDGITRNAIITIATDLGIPVIEKRITRDEVWCCDEAFFTGTAAEVTPIRELDNRTIGTGRRGPITERLQAVFFDTGCTRSPDPPDAPHDRRPSDDRPRRAAGRPHRRRRTRRSRPAGLLSQPEDDAVEPASARLPRGRRHRRGALPVLRHRLSPETRHQGPRPLRVFSPGAARRSPARCRQDARHLTPADGLSSHGRGPAA